MGHYLVMWCDIQLRPTSLKFGTCWKLNTQIFRSPTDYGKMWHFYKGKWAKFWSKSYFGSHFSHISQNFMPFSLHCYNFVALSVDTYLWYSLNHMAIWIYGHKAILWANGHISISTPRKWPREQPRWVSTDKATTM